jgi:hypothetical protein
MIRYGRPLTHSLRKADRADERARQGSHLPSKDPSVLVDRVDQTIERSRCLSRERGNGASEVFESVDGGVHRPTLVIEPVDEDCQTAGKPRPRQLRYIR